MGRALMRPPPPVTIVKQVDAPRTPVRQVLTLSGAFTPGDFVTGRALTWRELPADQIRAEHYTANTDEERRKIELAVAGATPRRALNEGTPLTRDALVFPGDHGFVASVLKPAMRAVSVPTSAVTSNSGLVTAGDRVDVILHLQRDKTQAPMPGAADASFTTLAAQTIVRNVRVLALNGNASGIAPGVNEPVASGAADKKVAPIRNLYESITLEVDPKDGERLALAQEVGTLQLALRSVLAGAVDQTHDRDTRVTRVDDTTDIFDLPRAQPVQVHTYRGDRYRMEVFRGAPPEDAASAGDMPQ